MQFFQSQLCYVCCTLILSILPSSSSRVKRGSGPKKVSLTQFQVKEILDSHNKLRASVSSSNMRYMTWDKELASISEKYGTKCQFSHNTKGSHSKFKTSVGENIFVSRSAVETFEASRAIQMWFDEKSDFDYDTKTCEEGRKCGHYTQVTWADSYKIGCSLTMCDYVSDFNQPDSHLFICNYSPAGNVYTLGPEGTTTMLTPFLKGRSCSQCRTPSDVCKQNLCANSVRDMSVAFTDPNPDPGDGWGNESCSGLVIAIIVLCLAFVLLLAFTIYREKVRYPEKFQSWSRGQPANHSKFSNQNTPIPSRSNTPRSSIVTTSLHGTSHLNGVSGRRSISGPILHRPSSPNKPAIRPKSRDVKRLYEKKPHSAPSSPRRPARPPPPSSGVV